ncbi:3-hydroxyacyl-CoA dehydrogenase [Chelativorans sp. Marseille-P2723]|uniref:3-hydroxyacyl-CoA dehydrogenase n=1 Tax=Chelativorans sp. Marseille-P2723 TaxID=2709133 RepID=UPI00156E45AF|nr:3-hydroxyacyl-CoA dehydrogenase [Chelativorans sp. Marseille-P2723]
MKETFEHVAIAGAGLVGCGWAVQFALAGSEVTLYDERAETRQSLPSRLHVMLDDLEKAGLAKNTQDAFSRLRICHTLENALDGADYVQESVFERVEVKAEVARRIGALISSQAIVGSSSSGIPASAFTQDAPNRERFLISHPVNPPHLAPVVELVPAPWTAPDAVPTVRRALAAIGKVPVEVKREIDGFILNRLQGALLNEAWALYEEGYASIQDIDATVAHGLGLRWAFMGPFETIDLNAPGGLADYAERLAPLYHGIALSRTQPRSWSADLIRRVSEERRQALPLDGIPARTRWRDRRLAALVGHLRAQERSDEN